MYYRICPYCGAHLDFGEICDCQGKKREAVPLQRERPQGKTPITSLAATSLEVKRLAALRSRTGSPASSESGLPRG